MDQLVETIQKNYEERMNEFVSILNREECLPGSRVLDEWRFHLELTLKGSGWTALYRPHKCIKQLNPTMEFSNEILIVEKVDLQSFEAHVVGAEQSDGSCTASESSSAITNKTFKVPLEDLYPYVNQPDFDVDGVEMANVLDQFRFFRTNLWLPWDEEGESEDWRVSCLEPRMQLLYDMERGLVPCELAERVRRLFRQSWRLHEQLQCLETAMGDDGSPLPVMAHADDSEALVIRVMQLHERMDGIKHQLNRLINPLIRNLMVREKQRMLHKLPEKENSDPWSRLVWGGGSTQKLAALTSEASVVAGSDQRFKVYPLLPMALEECGAGDSVLLDSDQLHLMMGSGGLEEGGTLRGLGKERARISGCEAGDVMLNVNCAGSAEGFTLSNVHLETGNVEICLLLHAGDVVIDNCIITGGGGLAEEDSVGVMVRAGGRLHARNCTFSGFTSGILAFAQSEVLLENCIIEHCATGVQIFKGAAVSLQKSRISDCSLYGICYKLDGSCNAEFESVTQETLEKRSGVIMKESELVDVPLMMEIGSGQDANCNVCM